MIIKQHNSVFFAFEFLSYLVVNVLTHSNRYERTCSSADTDFICDILLLKNVLRREIRKIVRFSWRCVVRCLWDSASTFCGCCCTVVLFAPKVWHKSIFFFMSITCIRHIDSSQWITNNIFLFFVGTEKV